jgi:peroxiredoxin Q/BCP
MATKKKTSTTKAAKKKTAKKTSTAAVKKKSKTVVKKSVKSEFAGPKLGSVAPSFSGTSDISGSIDSMSLRGKCVVLYFYPKDDTPGCTVQACGFRDSYAKLKKLNAEIIGVSADDLKSHSKFRDKFSLNFPLIADTDLKICKAYGVWVEKSMYGKRYMGIQRSTFLIDPTGNIAAVWPKVKVEEHAEEVAAAIKDL